jgi:anti-sigma factor RsiW
VKARTRPSPRCRALLLEVSRYLDGDLAPARRRAVERHISTCACCGTMAAQLKRTLAACRAEGANRLPRAAALRAAAGIRALVARPARVAFRSPGIDRALRDVASRPRSRRR